MIKVDYVSLYTVYIITFHNVCEYSCCVHVAVDFYRSLNTSKLLEIVNLEGTAVGVTVLNNELFVVMWYSKQVNVYESRDNNFTLTRQIQVTNLTNPYSLVSSDVHQCLYISDAAKPYVVHRIDVRNSSCSKWSVSAHPNTRAVCPLQETTTFLLHCTQLRE